MKEEIAMKKVEDVAVPDMMLKSRHRSGLRIAPVLRQRAPIVEVVK
jgi:hypothetical protein